MKNLEGLTLVPPTESNNGCLLGVLSMGSVFLYINLFDPHQDPMKWILLPPHVTDGETEAHRVVK